MASDTAVFNISTVNSAQTVNLNGDQSAAGLTFNNTGTTALQGGGTNRTLTLGTGGIAVNAGAGATTIGSATAGQQVAISLAGAQSWVGSGAGALTINNGVSLGSAGGQVLTLDGTNTGNNRGNVIAGAITNGAGTLGVTKTGSGTWTLSGANSYTGNTIVNAGILRFENGTLNQTTTFSGAGTGTVQMGTGVGGIATTAVFGSGFTGVLDIQSGGFSSNATSFVNNLGDLNVGATSTFAVGSVIGSVSALQFDAITGAGAIANGSAAFSRPVSMTVGANNGSGAFYGNITSASPNNARIALTKNGTGTQVFSGILTLGTGAITASQGSLIVTRLNNTTAASDDGTSNPSSGSSAVTVATGAAFAYQASSSTQATIASLAITGGAAGSGTRLGASIGTGTSGLTSATINATGAATATGNVTVDLYGAIGSTPTTGLYTLVQGGAGSNLSGATWTLGSIVYNNTNFTVNPLVPLVATPTALTIGIVGQTSLTDAYWKGGLSGAPAVWAASNGTSTSNWTATAGGSVQALVPGPNTLVHISATAPTVAPTATTLGANMSIKGLSIEDTTNGLGLNADNHSLTLGSGGITVNASVPASTIGADVVLGADQTWQNNSANTLTVSGAVMGASRNLTKAGTGKLVLSGANSYTGTTTVNAGLVQMSGAGTLGNINNQLTLNSGGTVDLNGTSQGVGNFTGTGGTLTNTGAAESTFTMGNGNFGGGNFAGQITGNLALTKVGTGTITLSGANTFTGALTIAGSYAGSHDIPGVKLAAGASLATDTINLGIGGSTANMESILANGAVNQMTNAVVNFNPSSGGTPFPIWETWGFSQSVKGVNAASNTASIIENTNGTASGSSIVTLTGGGSYSFGGTFRNGNASTIGLTVNMAPGGVQTLAGTGIIYTGATTVSSGTLVLRDTSAFASAINNTATVEFNATSGTSQTSAALSGAGTFNKTGSGVFQINSGNLAITTTGQFNIQAGTLQNNGNGVNWSGNTANIAISSGAILDLYADAIVCNALTGSGFVQNNFGNASGSQSGATAFYEKLTVGVAGGGGVFSGVIRDNSAGTTPASGTAGGGVELVKTGAGTQTLSGKNTYTGATTVSGGILQLDLTTNSNVINNGAVSTGTIASAGTVKMTGGTLDFTGGSVASGQAQALASVAVSSGTNRITNSGYTYDSAGSNTAAVINLGTLTRTGGTLDIANLVLDTTNTDVALGTANSWVRVSTATAPTALLSSSITANGGQDLVAVNSLRNLVVAQYTPYERGATALSNHASSIVKFMAPTPPTHWYGAGDNGTQTITLDPGSQLDPTTPGAHPILAGSGHSYWAGMSNAYASGETVVNIGANTLHLGVDGALLNGNAGATLTVGASGSTTGTLTAGGVNSGTAGTVAVNTAGTVNINSVVANNGVGGTVGLSVSGTGTTILNGKNTYTGTTTVDGGTLKIDGTGALGWNGSSANYAGAISVASGAAFTHASSVAQTLSGAISGTGGTLNFNGSGVVTLSGNANTALANINIGAGSEVDYTSTGANSWFRNNVGSLGFNAASAYTVTLGANATLKINDGGSESQILDQQFTMGAGSILSNTGTAHTGLYGILFGWDGAGGGNITVTGAGAQITADKVGFHNGAAITVNSGADLTITSIVKDSNGAAAAIIKAGAGALKLSGANAYSGVTDVQNGTLQLTGSLAAATALNLGNGTNSGKFILGGTGAAVNQTVADLTSTGTGTTNAVVGGHTTVSTLTVNKASGSSTFGGTLGGAGTNENNLALTKTGAGTLVLSGANTYAGATDVQNGTLQLTGSLNAATTLNLSNGTSSGKFILGSGTGAVNQTVANLTGSGAANAVVGGNAAVSTLTVNKTSGSSTFGGTLGGVGANENNLALTKTGAGTLTLTGANTYAGATTIGGGTLRLGASTTANIAGLNAKVWLDASTIATTGAVTSWTNDAVGGAGNFTGNGTVQAGVAGFNGLNVMHFDGNTQVLANTTAGYQVETILYVGALDGTDNQRLVGGTSTNWLMGYWGGKEDTAFDNAFVGAGGGSPNVSATTSSRVYSMTRDASTISLYKDGQLLGAKVAGNLYTTMSLGGSYTPAPENSAGSLGEVLVLNSALTTDQRADLEAYLQRKWFNVGTTNVLSTSTAVNITASGATLDVNGITQTIASLSGVAGSNVTLGNGTLTTGDATDTTFAGVISGAGGKLVKQGAGTFTLTGTNTYTGTTTLGGGILALGGIGALNGTSAVTFTGGTLQYSASNTVDYSAKVQNSTGAIAVDTNGQSVIWASALANTNTGGLTKAGAGTLTLASANNYTGATTVNGGILEVTADGALGTNATGTTVNAGGTLKLTNVTYLTTEALSLNGTGAGGVGALLNSGTSTYAGAITVASNATIHNGGGTLTLTGGVVKNGTTVTFAGAGTTNINTVGLSGASPNSDVVVNGLNLGGTVNLNALSTFNGPVSVTNTGSLFVNTTMNTTGGNVSVDGTSTLGGRGTITTTGTVSIAVGGQITGGQIGSLSGTDANNILHITAGTVNLSGTYLADINYTGQLGNQADGHLADVISVAGNVDLSGSTLALSGINTPAAAGAHYAIKLFEVTSGSITGNWGAITGLNTASGQTVVRWGNAYYLVPEPASFALLGLGSLLLLRRPSRRRGRTTA